MLARLEPAASALVDWAIDAALPLWATAGFDAERGRFEERLTLSGGRLPDVPLRLMSQARQIHVYALAARHGWHGDALALVERGFVSMVRDYRGRDDRPGWIFSIRRDGTISDARRDLYTHAFVLLAIASYVEATGDRAALALADETLAFIERHMAAPEGGGFVEELPPNGAVRRQNPHMHLFEGLLALWECSRQERYLARTTELFDLFAARFFRDPGVVGEYFTADLRPADGVVGRIVEPGHHHEWVRRIWPVTEAIKANQVEARHGRKQGEGRAAALAVLLRERFLTVDPPGGWLDRLDDKGQCVNEFIPASTLYHLLGAIDELSRFATPQVPLPR
jgi:mannose/cellobiose epimerase-like protein (N-acyl-D-glucosamine 2-epimerase family)